MSSLVLEEEIKQREPEEVSHLHRFFKHQFNWPWTLYDIIEFFIYGIVGIINCVIFSTSLNNSLVIGDRQRYPLLYSLSILSPLAGVYSMLVFKIRSNIWLNLATAGILVVVPLVILIALIATSNFLNEFYLAVTVIFIPVVTISFALHKLLREFLFKKFGLLVGGITNILLVIVYNIIFTLTICLATIDENTTTNPGNLITYPAVLYLLIILLVWIVIHTIIFRKQPSEREIFRNKVIALDELSMKGQMLLDSDPSILELQPEGVLNQHGHKLASAAIIVTLIGIEIGLVSVFSDIKSKKYPDSALYMAGFYIIALPLLLVCGLMCSASRLKKDDKFFISLLGCALLPTIAIMYLSYFLYTDKSTYYLGLVIGIGFPSLLLFWLSMSLIYNYSKGCFQYLSATCCLILVLPLFLMLPLYSAGGMDTATFSVGVILLVLGGIGILVIFLIQVFQKCSRPLFKLIFEVYSFNSYNLSQYIYSVAFLLGFALLGWMTFKKLSISNDWISGFIPGCFVIFGFMIIGTIIVHRLTLYTSEPGIPRASIKDILSNSQPASTPLQITNLIKKKNYEMLLTSAGILAAFLISIPILASASTDSGIYCGVTIMVGLLIGTLFLVLMVEFKAVLRHFGGVFLSYTVGCCWIFILVPFVCVVPVSLGLASDSEELHSVTSWSIGVILILFMVGVSIGSITLNLMFKKMEYEKVAKYCCTQVQEALMEVGVKAETESLRIMYDNFQTHGKEFLEEVLESMSLYYFRDIQSRDTEDLRFGKEIVSAKELEKERKKKEKEQEKEQEKGKGKEIEREKNEEKAEEKKKKKIENSKDGVTLVEMIKKICCSKKKEHANKVAQSEINQKTKNDINEKPAEENKNNVEIPIQKKKKKKGKSKRKKHIIKITESLENREKIDDSDHKISEIEENINDQQYDSHLTVNKPKRKKHSHNNSESELLPNVVVDVKKLIKSARAIKLSAEERQMFINSEHFRHILSNEALKRQWLESVFDRFATSPLSEGSQIYSEEDEPFMTLSDLRQFIRLSGLKPYIPNVTCDLHFVRLTRIYDTVTATVTIKKFRFNDFLKALFEFAKLRFPQLTPEEAEDELFRLEIYPNLVGNLPDLVARAKNKKITEELRPSPKKENEIQVVIPSENKVTGLAKKFCPCFGLFFKIVLKFIKKGFKLCVSCLNPSDDSITAVNEHAKPQSEIDLSRKESPPWEEISHIIARSMSESDTEIRKSQAKRSPGMQLNLSNILGIVSDISELYSFSAIGFSEQVGWVYGRSFTDSSTVILSDNKYWSELFWTSFVCGLIFLGLLVPASKFIKAGRLGLNKDFTPAGPLTLQFYLNKVVTTFGSSLYLTIIVSMLNAFSCNYSNGDWHLLRDPSIVCFSGEHTAYFVLAIIILMFYYPTATLLYPNIAFQDKVLDLKFDTTFLVLESQGKLVIAGFFAFFAKELYISLQLIVAIFVCFALFLISWRMRPSLVERYNLWKTGGFIAPIWICICALINLHSGQTILAIVLLILGLVALVGALVLLHLRGNKIKVVKKKEGREIPRTEHPSRIMERLEVESGRGFAPPNSPGKFDD